MTKLVKQPAELKKKVFSPKQKRQFKFAKGLQAEKIALDFLLTKNYLLLAKNLRVGNSELDLIVFDQTHDEIVFVEVKHRQTSIYGEASQAVDQRKLSSMLKVANAYLKKIQFQKSYRFDIISITGNLAKPSIAHYQNVTWL